MQFLRGLLPNNFKQCHPKCEPQRWPKCEPMTAEMVSKLLLRRGARISTALIMSFLSGAFFGTVMKHTYLASVGRRSSSSLLWGDHIGATLGPYWDHIGTTLGPHWGHTGATLGQHWGNIGATLWPYYGHVGATLGPHWGRIRATFKLWGNQRFYFCASRVPPRRSATSPKYGPSLPDLGCPNVVQRGPKCCPNVSPMWPNAGGRIVAPN